MFPADSPFADKLHTNYLPTESEISGIRNLLVVPAAELARVDAQINELMAKRESLKTAIDAHNAHNALISPLRRVPQDVLQEIFLACLPTAHNAVIDPGEAPLLLGRICSHWRSLAWSTPRIWSSLHIPSLSYRIDVPPGMVLKLNKTVEAWLNRSAMCPLSISFYRTPYDTRDDDITFDDQLNPINQLLRVSRRIRHLELVSDTPAIYDPLLRLGLEDLPALEKFLLHGYNDSDSLPEFRDWIDFFGIPNLRSISLYVTTDALSLPLRWSHLTELCLVCFPSGWGYDGGLDEYGVLDVLRRCPNIVRCQIQATKPKGSERRDTSSLTLLHLQTLILGDEYPLVEALSLLVLPKLSWLQIGEKFFEEPIRFLDRPVQGLTMELDIFRFTLSNLVELLQHFPTTTDLRLYWSRPYAIPLCADDAFLSLFCPPHDVLCPALTYISFSPISCVGLISDAAALAFIRARMVMDYPLRRFQARFERRMETDILLELQSFISGGLEVDLDYFAPQWAFQPRNGISSLYG